MNASKYDNLAKVLKKGQVRVCLVKRKAEIEFEYYRNRKVETAAQPIHSCSKSIMAMLIGICVGQGLILDINVPIKEFFGGYPALRGGSGKDAITLCHLLTMTPGFDWPEFGAWNYGTPMEYSTDIVSFILNRDMESQPGEKMVYNSGCSHLLSAIIQTVSGVKTIDFAYKHLFVPLGIKDVIWHEKQGINLGANGLRMTASDMLTLGSLCLQQGEWNGEQLVPGEWIIESTKPRILSYPEIGHYGYHWWFSELEHEGKTVPYYFAMGLFGQFIIVVPEHETVVVFISENYGETMQPMRYFRDIIAPALDI